MYLVFREKEPLPELRLPSARTTSLELKAWLPWPIRLRKVPQGREIVTAEEVTNKNSHLYTRNLIEVLSKVNVKSYTSAFEPSMPMPSDCDIEQMKGMMEELKPKVKNLYKKLCEFIPVFIKVAGSSVSLVGDGLVIGGAVAAPFTLICGGGGATSAGAGLVELYYIKKERDSGSSCKG